MATSTKPRMTAEDVADHNCKFGDDQRKFRAMFAEDGNGAREALVDVALSLLNDTARDEAESWSDWLLLELGARGFKVVPLHGQGH